MTAVPGPPPLRTSVIVDYQNVHLVGHEAFPITRHLERHASLIDPLLFSYELIRQRNAAMGPGYSKATLQDVWVYRGLPSSEYDPVDNSRSLAQQHHWERDGRVHVTLRPLRYRLARDVTGRPLCDVNGNVTITEKREKGVDVLCALAVVREAARTGVDVVILASHDSDLEPAIDEARELSRTKIETFRWSSPDDFVYQLRSGDRSRPIWCTKLDERSFRASWDLTPY